MKAGESLAILAPSDCWDAERLAQLDERGASPEEQRERSRQGAARAAALAGKEGSQWRLDGLRASLKEAAERDLPFLVEALAELGAPIESVGGAQSPLMRAAELGAARAFEALLRLGAKPAAQDIKGRTAMHYAAIGGSASIVRRAAKAGMSVRQRDAAGGAPLTLAALSGCGLSAKAQSAGAEPKVTRVRRRGFEALDALIELGARVDDPHPQYGQSPLFDLCELDDDGVEAARALLERGADPNGAGLDRAPLMGAMSSYRASGGLCELLIAYGARVSAELLGHGRKNNPEAFSVCERRLLEMESAKSKREPKRRGL